MAVSRASKRARRSFFFQAEDGIRDWSVTGVQTCALPISRSSCLTRLHRDLIPDAGSSEPTNKFQQPVSADHLSDLREQSGVIDPVEKFLAIHIHHPAIA